MRTDFAIKTIEQNNVFHVLVLKNHLKWSGKKKGEFMKLRIK